MTPDDIFRLVSVSDPRVSPDGTRVAFVVTRVDRASNEYRSAVWIGPADGSSPAMPVTSGAKTDTSPRWSPDGRSIAFVSTRGGEQGQLYVLPLQAGEARKITDLRGTAAEPAWSPSGSLIAFVSRVPDPAYDETDERKRPPRRFKRLGYKLDNIGFTSDRPSHVFVVPADGSREPMQLTAGGYQDASPAWSPDSTRIVFVSARHDDFDVILQRDLYLVGVARAGEEPELLTATDGLCSSPSWSPGGERIAYRFGPGRDVWDWPHHTQIAVIDLDARERLVLTESLDRQCAPSAGSREPIWLDGGLLLFGVEDRGNVHLYRTGLDSVPEPVLTGERVITGYDASGGVLVDAATTHTRPAELFRGESRLTNVGSAFAEVVAPVGAERFTATSRDGSQVDAWIMRPPGFDGAASYPVLLNIHGGPFTQYGTGFFEEFQVYASAGYVVLFANPRGSSGYTDEWGRAIRGPVDGGPGWGTVDFEDLMAVVDTALERYPFCDRDRLGVMGGSYGGYMTSWIVGHTNRFAAACSERAVNNWVSMYGSSDIGWSFRSYFGSFVYEDVATYLKHSPATYAQDMRTPLLILHSENDLRCPIEQAEHLFITLRLLGRDVELVRFPGEGHELTRSGSPVHRKQRFEIILEWFDRHLKS